MAVGVNSCKYIRATYQRELRLSERHTKPAAGSASTYSRKPPPVISKLSWTITELVDAKESVSEDERKLDGGGKTMLFIGVTSLQLCEMAAAEDRLRAGARLLRPIKPPWRGW